MDLAEMQLDYQSAKKWEVFRQPPERDQTLKQQGRAAFLAQVDAISAPAAAKARASKPHFLEAIGTWFRTSRLSPAFMPIMTIVIALVFLLTAGSAVAYAAQGSLPGEPFYAIKTASEDVRYSLAANNERRLQLDLEFNDRRVDEIVAMNASGQEIPAAIADRMQQNLHSSLVIAGSMDDRAMRAALVQIQQRTELQHKVISQLPNQMDPFIARIRSMLQLQLVYTKMGLEAPQDFRQQLPGLEATLPTQQIIPTFNSPTIKSTPGSPQPGVMPTEKSLQATPGQNNPSGGQSSPAPQGPSGSGVSTEGQTGGSGPGSSGTEEGSQGPGSGDGDHKPGGGTEGGKGKHP